MGHINPRPVVPGVDAIQEALIHPIKITAKLNHNNVRNYFRFDAVEREFLIVVVKYLNGTGFIITAYPIRKIK